ncbi:CopG family ribbon-helix-helix protein [Halomarina ordinaria]|uniref:CopG family ribbon-helix-helix protein n=1 Tax=Halomarina ordinaria TaxID=3033939 RepID=A0ABD5UHK8_9EURY|nr:CopG family ribbon-helix-helix protein [Halomarina sp. PSRA2]
MRTSFNIPDEVVEDFDRVWQEQGLDSRSRGVREAMLEYIEAHSRLETTSGRIVALLGYDYQHDEVIHDLHDVHHEYQDVIQSMSHTHQGDWCLEAVFCRGDAEQIRSLTYRLRDFDGVRRVRVMLIPTERSRAT